MASLENNRIKLVIALGKGADIVEILHMKRDIDCMWHSFNGLAARGISENEGGGGRQLYRCLCGKGWQELSRPTALPQIIITGAQIGTHGEHAFIHGSAAYWKTAYG